MTSSRPVSSRLTQLLARVRRSVLLRRRLIAVVLVSLAGLVALGATAEPTSTDVPMVVAAADLPAGTVLGADDLATATVDAEDRPGSAVRSTRDLLGRRLAVELRQGEPVGEHRLAGGTLADSASGLTAVPVRLADGTALLRAGDRLDLVSSDGQGAAATIARGLPVLGTTGDAAGGGAAGWQDAPAPGGGSDGLVVLGVPAAQVDVVVGAHAAGSLFFTFSP